MPLFSPFKHLGFYIELRENFRVFLFFPLSHFLSLVVEIANQLRTRRNGPRDGITEKQKTKIVIKRENKPDPNKKWQQPMDAPGPQATLQAMKDVMAFWLKMGCDGFRVDMAGSLVKHDENSKGTISLWQNVREFFDKEFPDAAMISEWGEPDKSILGGFHMDFLLHFGPSHYNDLFRCEQPYFSSRGKGTAFEFIKKYKENYEKSDKKGLICIPSGNHDMDRLARHLSVEEMKIAFAFLLTMPGAPFIYYGDEIGMRYVENLISVEGGYGRTGSRSPMQWDNSTNAGFSLAPKENLYVPQDESQDRPTVENQIKDENSLWKEVQKLIKIRQENKTLQNLAEIEFLSDGSTYPLVYQRIEKSTQEKITVILNPSEKECSYEIKDGQIICSNSPKAQIDKNDGKIFVPPVSYAIVKNH